MVVCREDGKPAFHGYREGISLSLERARLITDSYKETEGQPEVIRRAKGLANILENMTIYIGEGERIVGNESPDPHSIRLHPELHHRQVTEALNNGLRPLVDDKIIEEWMGIDAYWEGKSIDDRIRAILPDEVKDFVDFHGGVCYANHWSNDLPGAHPDYRFLFQRGFNGIIDIAEKKLNELRDRMVDFQDSSQVRSHIDRQHFYEAVIIVSKATINFAHRYAEKARELARIEAEKGVPVTANPGHNRVKELEEIAEICDRVPANPPSTFHEAVQAYFFCHLIRIAIQTDHSGEGSRFDQVVYPLYKKDIEEGRITREQAQELLEYLWIKMEELGHEGVREVHGAEAGGSLFQTMTIGGTTPDGEDATNEVSFLMMDASMSIGTIQPTFVLRYHPKIDPALISKAIDCVKTGLGFPAFLNDNTIVPALVEKWGIPVEEARGYSGPGCVGVTIPGRNMDGNNVHLGGVNMAKCLELALNQGVDMRRGTHMGYTTPDPTTFTCIEDVMDAFEKQIDYVVEKIVKIANLAQVMYERYMHLVFSSAIFEDCLEKGVDVRTPTYHEQSRVSIIGAIDTSNSLATIKKLVFDDKSVSMEKLLEACKANWEGEEVLRQMCLEAPKFGNDDDDADMLAREVHHRAQAVLSKYKNYFGYNWDFDGGGAAGYYPWGRWVWALPDGRKAKETCTDGSLSPKIGTDTVGPTAVLSSMAKVPPIFPELANQKFMPQFLEGQNKELFAAYLKTWSELPIWHVQFNVVDADTLRDAQKNPDNYRELTVRVAGFSAYFVDLPTGLQEEIIGRTAQSFGC